jgi:hypothetical protein
MGDPGVPSRKSRSESVGDIEIGNSLIVSLQRDMQMRGRWVLQKKKLNGIMVGAGSAFISIQ